MTAFVEARFPSELVTYRPIGGPSFNTTVVEVESGQESRNGAWAQPRRRYEVDSANRTQAEADRILGFFMSMQGKLIGFRFRDWADYKVGSGQGIFLKLTSSTFQFLRRYTAVLGYAGTSSTSLAIGTGTKTFTTQAGLKYVAGDRARATYAYDGAQFMEGAVTSYSGTSLAIDVDLIGSSGTVAAWDVNLAGTIFDRKIRKPVYQAAVVGGTVASIDYTTGVVTMTSGTPTSWTGEFDVPVRFDIDELKPEVVNRSGQNLIIGYSSIPLVEVRV